MFIFVFALLAITTKQEVINNEERKQMYPIGYCAKFIDSSKTIGCQPNNAEGILIDFSNNLGNFIELAETYKDFIASHSFTFFTRFKSDLIPLINIKYLNNKLIKTISESLYPDTIKTIVFYIPKERYEHTVSREEDMKALNLIPFSIFFILPHESEQMVALAQNNLKLLKQKKLPLQITKLVNNTTKTIVLSSKMENNVPDNVKQLIKDSPGIKLKFSTSDDKDGITISKDLIDEDISALSNTNLYVAPYNRLYFNNQKLPVYKNKSSVLRTFKYITDSLYTPTNSRRTKDILGSFIDSIDPLSFRSPEKSFEDAVDVAVLLRGLSEKDGQKDNNRSVETKYSNKSKAILIQNQYDFLNVVSDVPFSPATKRITNIAIFLQIISDIQKTTNKLLEKLTAESDIEKLKKFFVYDEQLQIHFMLNTNSENKEKGESLLFKNYYNTLCENTVPGKFSTYRNINPFTTRCYNNSITAFTEGMSSFMTTKYDLIMDTSALTTENINLSKGMLGLCNKKLFLKEVLKLFSVKARKYETEGGDDSLKIKQVIIDTIKLLELKENNGDKKGNGEVDDKLDESDINFDELLHYFETQLYHNIEQNYNKSNNLITELYSIMQQVFSANSIEYKEWDNFDLRCLNETEDNKDNKLKDKETITDAENEKNKDDEEAFKKTGEIKKEELYGFSTLNNRNVLNMLPILDGEISFKDMSDKTLASSSQNVADFNAIHDNILTTSVSREKICSIAKNISLSLLKLKFKDEFELGFDDKDCSISGEYLNNIEESNLFFNRNYIWMNIDDDWNASKNGIAFIYTLLLDLKTEANKGSICTVSQDCGDGEFVCMNKTCVLRRVDYFVDWDTDILEKKKVFIDDKNYVKQKISSTSIFKSLDYTDAYLKTLNDDYFEKTPALRYAVYNNWGSHMENYTLTSKRSEVTLLAITLIWFAVAVVAVIWFKKMIKKQVFK